MRTRTSNRSKRYTVEKYDFEVSSDEEPAASRRRKIQDLGDQSDEFDAEEAGNASQGDDNDEEVLDDEASQSDPSASDGETTRSRPPQRPRATRPKARAGKATKTAYLNLEPPSAESHLIKGYTGRFDRMLRGPALIAAWYGPNLEKMIKAEKSIEHWIDWSLLPPKEPLDTSSETPWSDDLLDREAVLCDNWKSNIAANRPSHTILSPLSAAEATPYLPPPGTLPVLMGPHDSQIEVKFRLGHSESLSALGVPLEQAEAEASTTSAGWLLDAGGPVLSLDWARQSNADAIQLLALSAIPYSDQEIYNYEEEASKPDHQMHGSVQIWAFRGKKSGKGIIQPSCEPPQLQKTLCVYGGRARSVKWSPACQHLALLCGGVVFVVDPGEGGDRNYEELHQPLVALCLPEEGVKATAMAWVNFNRLAIGYSDGSIALWSLYPACMLSRHSVHHSIINNMVSGYPSLPYVIASIPVGGFMKLIDLRSPSLETTEVPVLSVNTSPNMVSYCEHLLGFFSLAPSSNVLNTMVAFMHHAHFPVNRRVITCDRLVTSLSAGKTHPYLLVGAIDGSLWALNSLPELFHNRRELTDRIKIFQHEHRPAGSFPQGSPAAERGVSRVIQGFKPEKNRHTKADAPGKAKKKAKGSGEDADAEDANVPGDPTRGVANEYQTRITVVEWNPNKGYGTWAAAGMGSGLVRVMDLGLDVAEPPA